jgi:peroxidase
MARSLDLAAMSIFCCCVTFLLSLYQVSQIHATQVDDVRQFLKDCYASDASIIGDDINSEERTAAAMKNKPVPQKPAEIAGHFMGNSKKGKELEASSKLERRCLKKAKEQFGLSKSEMEAIMAQIGTLLDEKHNNGHGPSVCGFDKPERFQCDNSAKYRTFDGTCNNIHHPAFGAAFQPLKRVLPADYADGIDAPRADKNGNPLPGARTISIELYTQMPDNQPSHTQTVMFMVFGQFCDHDIDRTAISKFMGADDQLVDVRCGDDGCHTNGEENKECYPIWIPDNDPAFKNRCIKFVRTSPVTDMDCEVGPRQQLNQITSYLDCSNVYGSTDEQNAALRDTDQSRGKLRTTPHPLNSQLKDLLPQFDDPACRDNNDTIRCFRAGDGRVNEQIGLTTMHTLFHRAHNTIEEKLHNMNPGWDGEKLFQEARKILIGAWQHITYNEYLPLVLGPQAVQKYGLQLEDDDYFKGYSNDVNADVSNSFATGSYRFGHSQIGDFLTIINDLYNKARQLKFSTVLNRPLTIYDSGLSDVSGIDGILNGMISQPSERVDRFFSDQMSVFLFSEDPPNVPGMDLPAVNTQRGRDHGLPSYNQWRRHCDLSVAASFNDLVDISPANRMILKKLYAHVDDIDFYAGGIAEEHVPGGVVGPVFACNIGEQFRDLRAGDRFWYENKQSGKGFTKAQLQEIRKFTLSRLICDNADLVNSIQKYVMLLPKSEVITRFGSAAELYALLELYGNEDNARVPCNEIPEPDLSKWQD